MNDFISEFFIIITHNFPIFTSKKSKPFFFFLLFLNMKTSSGFFKKKTKRNKNNFSEVLIFFTFWEVARVHLARVPLLLTFIEVFGGAFLLFLASQNEGKKLNLAASL